MTTVVALGAAGALALTGCSSSKKNTGSGGLGGGGNPSGASSSGSGGGPSGTIKIGFEGPLSGANAQLGINEEYGAEIAVQQANADSSLGFKVQLVTSDDEGDPAKSPAAATKLIQDPTILGVIGPSFSGSTLAVGKAYSAAGMAFITPSASNGTLQQQGFSTFHRIIPNDNVEGSQGADWLARKG
ncbi:MAG TPA: branched-chain amino acid ABC transporter substrate-binding protein, partial [Jatrophihabitans sp.]|nr:branched-chain amino acid ABC transporter substrate-binding protein [Jatrophihabitans sp.]